MAIEIRGAPLFTSLVANELDPSTNSVRLAFATTDGEPFGISIEAGAIPPTVAALAGGQSALLRMLPASAGIEAQPLVAKGIDLMMADDGELAWEVRLQNGLRMTLQIPPASIPRLARTFATALEIVNRKMQ